MTEWLRRLSRPIGELVQRRAVTGSEAEPLFGLVVRMREAGEAAALTPTTVTPRPDKANGRLELGLASLPVAPSNSRAAISTIMPGHPEQLFEGAEEGPSGE
jgi:hypothetical protein